MHLPELPAVSPWRLSTCGDAPALALADRHYSRQSVGHPKLGPPGRNLVLLAGPPGRALWVTTIQQHVLHRWPGLWHCTLFRNEGAGVASQLVRAAVAASVAHFGPPPEGGMLTFVDPREVRPTIVRGVPAWGYCFRRAGFVDDGVTARGLLALVLPRADFPPPLAPAGAQARLFGSPG